MHVKLANLVAACERMATGMMAASDRHRWVICGIALALVLSFHVFVASHLINTTNLDPTRSDQGAELWLAGVTAYHNDLWPQRSDGVRHPLWSWLARFVEHPDTATFFERGKWLNTGLTCVLLAALGVLATAAFGGLAGVNVLVLSSLGILLVRAVFFQPEPLYYGFSFFASVCAWRILRYGSWLCYPVFGVLAGLAYLAKPSFEPLLIAFLSALIVRTVCERAFLPAVRDLAGLLFAGLIAVAMIVPLGLNKLENFGSPTFSYPKIWMWMDDFNKEAWPWQDAHPGKAQLEKIESGETPSLGWYLKRHSLQDAVVREITGTQVVLARFLFPEPRRSFGDFFWKTGEPKRWEQPISHRGIYLGALLLLPVLLLAGQKIPRGIATPVNLACATFAVFAFCIYLALYGWYYPIGRGDRFMGSLWIPCIVLATLLGRSAWALSLSPFKNSLFVGLHLLVLASLLLQTLNLATLLLAGTELTIRN